MKVTEEFEVAANRIKRRIQEENDSILAIRDQMINTLQCSSGNPFAIACEVEVAGKRMAKALAEIDALNRELNAYNEAIFILKDCGVE